MFAAGSPAPFRRSVVRDSGGCACARTAPSARTDAGAGKCSEPCHHRATIAQCEPSIGNMRLTVNRAPGCPRVGGKRVGPRRSRVLACWRRCRASRRKSTASLRADRGSSVELVRPYRSAARPKKHALSVDRRAQFLRRPRSRAVRMAPGRRAPGPSTSGRILASRFVAAQTTFARARDPRRAGAGVGADRPRRDGPHRGAGLPSAAVARLGSVRTGRRGSD